jgi:hypothetical protein
MTTDLNTALVEALERFLRQAKEAVDEERDRDTPLPPTPHMLAEHLVDLPTGHEVTAAASQAAAANGYSVTAWPRRRSSEQADTAEASEDSGTPAAPPSRETAEPSGRPLDADALISTGVFGMLHSSAPHDFHAVAEELAGYLAGPPVGIWDYAILDANLTTDDPISVIDGWELVSPTTEDLRQLLPLPATAMYQSNRPFKPQDYAGLTMLRRSREDRPNYGPIFRWDILYALALDRPAHPLWRPLLALSLFDNPVLQLCARYEVEPGRRIDKLFDNVDWEVWIPDGVTEVERPRTGDFGENADLSMLRRFLAELAPRIPEAPHVTDNKKSKRSKKKKSPKEQSDTRLRRCAEHFLSAGEHAHGEGEVFSELNAETVLHYVIALEGLLTGDDENQGELTRKVSQRAAILASNDGARRLEIAKLVRDAYGARSAYAHGSEPDTEIDLPKLRYVVRRCILARLIVGDPTAAGPLSVVADRALLAHDVLDQVIRQPIEEFGRRVRA